MWWMSEQRRHLPHQSDWGEPPHGLWRTNPRAPHITHMHRFGESRNKIMYNCHNPDRKGNGWKRPGRKEENEKGGDAGKKKTQQQMVLVSSSRTEGSSESLGRRGTKLSFIVQGCVFTMVHVCTHTNYKEVNSNRVASSGERQLVQEQHT